MSECQSKLFKCPNCGREHPAWSLECENPEVKKMRAKCTHWREQGPPWASGSQQQSQPSKNVRPVFYFGKDAQTPENKSGQGTETGGKAKTQKRPLSPTSESGRPDGPTKIKAAINPASMHHDHTKKSAPYSSGNPPADEHPEPESPLRGPDRSTQNIATLVDQMEKTGGARTTPDNHQQTTLNVWCTRSRSRA